MACSSSSRINLIRHHKKSFSSNYRVVPFCLTSVSFFSLSHFSLSLSFDHLCRICRIIVQHQICVVNSLFSLPICKCGKMTISKVPDVRCTRKRYHLRSLEWRSRKPASKNPQSIFSRLGQFLSADCQTNIVHANDNDSNYRKKFSHYLHSTPDFSAVIGPIALAKNGNHFNMPEKEKIIKTFAVCACTK